MNRILIIGGSGFIGHALYKNLMHYYDVHATYHSHNITFEHNQKFHQLDVQQQDIYQLLDQIKPRFVVSAIRGNLSLLVQTHQRIIEWMRFNDAQIIFLSSANVFDRFTNFPSYEYDKTFSESIYGRYKINIENALMRLDPNKHTICRIPMIYGYNSPRVKTIKDQLKHNEAIEVFPNVVINATYIDKLTQQIHYIINKNLTGIYHLGSTDVIHHIDLIKEICSLLGTTKPLLKQVYDRNEDRQLSVLPKYNLLPDHLQITIDDVIASCNL